jgi:hypothetical protein
MLQCVVLTANSTSNLKYPIQIFVQTLTLKKMDNNSHLTEKGSQCHKTHHRDESRKHPSTRNATHKRSFSESFKDPRIHNQELLLHEKDTVQNWKHVSEYNDRSEYSMIQYERFQINFIVWTKRQMIILKNLCPVIYEF